MLLIVIILSLIIVIGALGVYFHLYLPMKALRAGVELIRSQDFGSRIRLPRHVGSNELVDTFNFMIDTLHKERISVRETNRYLDLLINSSPMGVLNFDHEGCLVLVNPAALRFFGVRDPKVLMGLSISDMPGRLGNALAELEPDSSVVVDARPDEGDDNIYRLSRFTFIDRGITRSAVLMERMTDVIRKTERESYGKLIRVMAHEINNAMGAVSSTFEFLSDLPLVTDDADIASLIDSCADRCHSLCTFVDKYAGVARLPAPDLASVNIPHFMQQLLPVLRQTILSVAASVAESVRPEISLTLRIGGSHASVESSENTALTSYEVMIDRNQIGQVIVNIVKNAAESILRRITGNYDSCNHDTSETEAHGNIVMDLGPDRKLTVTDNGAGISSEAAEKLFTPFFSTKREGSSSGTGLTLTAEILRAHNFPFSLRTDPATSLTTFTISFPR